MDVDLRAAAGALSVFDPLAAMKRIALRNDPPALALRGIAMAQLGDFGVARKLLARAARAFGASDPVAKARCLVAETEVALASRDLAMSPRGLEDAARVLKTHGDRSNAVFAELQIARHRLLLGDSKGAAQALDVLSLRGVPARLAAIAELVRIDVAVRRVRARDARAALARARTAATRAGIPALAAEVDAAARNLTAPVARLRDCGIEQLLTLDEVETLFASGELIVDACRRQVRAGETVVTLVTRPVLFMLARVLGEAGATGAPRETLIRRAFDAKVNESLRVRLRVEIGRLRRVLSGVAEIRATAEGFAIAARGGGSAVVLEPPEPGEPSALLALLGDGESWSTSALAAATGRSQRAVQRDLGGLLATGRVQAAGRGRACRWLLPQPAGFATTLLLVARPERV